MFNQSRRHLIAAIGAIPLATMIAANSAPARSPDFGLFANRLAAYHRCKANQEAFHAEHVAPACQVHDAAPEGSAEARETIERVFLLEHHFDGFVDLTGKAFGRVMRTPAPDLAALRAKLEIFIAEESHDDTDAGELVAAMLADVVRLGG